MDFATEQRRHLCVERKEVFFNKIPPRLLCTRVRNVSPLLGYFPNKLTLLDEAKERPIKLFDLTFQMAHGGLLPTQVILPSPGQERRHKPTRNGDEPCDEGRQNGCIDA
jgi:hypothetical protein